MTRTVCLVEAEDAALGDVDLDHTLTDTQSATADDHAPTDASETAESSQGPDQTDAARHGRISLLRELVDVLPTLTDKGGVGIIPLMQVCVIHDVSLPVPYGTATDQQWCHI